MDSGTLEIDLDRGVLTIAGQRPSRLAQPRGDNAGPQPHVHVNERVAGKLRRVITLPEDAGPDAVTAT